MSGDRRELGARGERLAESYLRRQGYVIVERNYCSGVGEIDLIALHRSTIVFIEVKTRLSTDFSHPLDAVDRHKQRQIVRAAQTYLRRKRLLDRLVRFDVVGITFCDGKPSIDLVCDAFGLP